MSAGRVNVGGVEIDVRADASALEGDFRRAQDQAKRFAAVTSSETDRANRSIDSLGSTIGKLGAAFIAAAAAAGALNGVTKTLADFGQSMSTLKAVLSATDAQMEQLTAKAKQLGSSTRFSASQAAEGMIFLARAGFSAEEALASIEGTLQLAQAGGLDLGRAADIASNVLSGFALEVNQTRRVVDVLAKAANSANTNVSQLGEAMKFAAPTAVALGIGLEETAAIIGKLSDAGIQGGLAGRGFQSFITAFVKQKEKITAMIGEFDLAADGISDIMRRLVEAGITTEQVVELFRSENLDVFTILKNAALQGAGGIDDLNKKLLEAEGTAATAAKTMDENLNGAILAAQSAFEALVLAVGEAFATKLLIDIFTAVAVALRGAADAVSWFSKELTDVDAIKTKKAVDDLRTALDLFTKAQTEANAAAAGDKKEKEEALNAIRESTKAKLAEAKATLAMLEAERARREDRTRVTHRYETGEYATTQSDNRIAALQREISIIENTLAGEEIFNRFQQGFFAKMREGLAALGIDFSKSETNGGGGGKGGERAKTRAELEQESRDYLAGMFYDEWQVRGDYRTDGRDPDPFAGLDIPGQDEFRDYIAEAMEEGMRLGLIDTPAQAAFRESMRNSVKNALRQGIETDDWGSALRSVLANAITGAMDDALNRLADTLIDILMPRGGGGVGGFISSIFGGSRAGGGPVKAGRAYRINEMGGEMFMPDIDGYVLPNPVGAKYASMGGGASRNFIDGSVSVTINGNLDGVTQAQLQETLDAHRRALPAAIDKRVTERRTKGAY